MRWILLAVSGISLAGWIFFGSTPNLLGLPTPALGKFYHPTMGVWRNAIPANTNPLKGEISVDHPLAKGKIFYDERNVPHIFTKTVEEGLFLQGYITARDRLWQMDISSRSTGGELSEVLGERTVARDKRQIRHGFRAAAELGVKTWKEKFPADYALLMAYCDGVNAYINQLKPEDYPLEYKLLGHAPRKWTPYHSVLMLKGMTQSMTDRSSDAAYEKAIADLGMEAFNDLYPKWYPKQTPIVPSGTSFQLPAGKIRERSPLPVVDDANQLLSSSVVPEKAESETSLTEDGFRYNDYRPGNGSNNWAIAGSKSLTGRPILAGDPHLGLSLPSIWYELQLHTEEGNVRGVSLPGLPFVVIGFNDNIAWSMTNGSEDVVDYYRMDWVDSTRTAYHIGGQTHTLLLRQDSLKINGEATQLVTSKWTKRGPIAVDSPDSPYYGLAKDAIYLYTQTDRPFTEITVLRKMLSAKNYDDFKVALRGYSEPIMNFAYADKHGDIAIIANGFWPLRQTDSLKTLAGLTVSDGSLENPNWTGYIPFEQLPQQHNPRRGFVSSANQPPTDEAYPYLYYGGFPTWRGRYINRKLTQAKRLDYKDMQALQQDAHSIMAEELLPLLLARINRRQLTKEGMRWFRALAEWDYAYTKESKAAAFFERWRKKAYQLTIDEIGTEEGYPALPLWRWIALLREKPNHKLFDIQESSSKETAAIITQRAFDETLEIAEENGIKSWVNERNSQLNHLGRIPGFGAGLLVTDGHNTAPNAVINAHGPSWRMVVELGDKPHAYGVLPGGASGNPAGVNYEGGVEEWSRGRYFDLSYWPTIEVAMTKASGQLTFE